MINKLGKDVAVGELTPDTYKVPAGEERLYHCIIEVVQYDPKTGKKISKPRVQKFGRKTFETTVYKTLKKQGYAITILHDPKGIEETAAKKKAENEKAKFDAAVEAKVKEVIASMQAEAERKAAEEAEAKAKAEAAAKAEAEKKAAEEAPKAETPTYETPDYAKTAEVKTEEAKKPGRPKKD